MPGFAFIAAAYLVGSLPQLRLLARLRHLNTEGDLHIGLWEQGGHLVAVIGVFGDFAKGVIVILVGRQLNLETSILALAGLAVVSGQMWPLFTGFDGEKGNSVGIAMAATLTPVPLLIALVPIATGLIIRMTPRVLKSEPPIGGRPSLSLPLGMAIGFLVLPFAGLFTGEPPVIFWAYLALFLLIMLRRVTAGLRADLAEGDTDGIFINRLLFDRSRI